MKQPQYSPLSVAEMALTLYAVNNGYTDDIDVKHCLAFEAGLRAYMKSQHPHILAKIEETKDLDPETEKQLAAAIEAYKKTATF